MKMVSEFIFLASSIKRESLGGTWLAEQFEPDVGSRIYLTLKKRITGRDVRDHLVYLPPPNLMNGETEAWGRD